MQSALEARTLSLFPLGPNIFDRFAPDRFAPFPHKPDPAQTQLLGLVGSGGARSFRALVLAPQSKVFSSIPHWHYCVRAHPRSRSPGREGSPPVLPSFAGSLCPRGSSRPRFCAIVYCHSRLKHQVHQCCRGFFGALARCFPHWATGDLWPRAAAPNNAKEQSSSHLVLCLGEQRRLSRTCPGVKVAETWL